MQDSSMIAVLSRSDGLIVRAPNAPAAPAGAAVEVLPFALLGSII
jgi:molybdopterin molybdotransferase